jgi:hypothetical protein
MPENIMPMTAPTGLPALKHANARFFRFDGRSYAAPRMPTAGGTVPADHNPKRPTRMSRYMALVAKPAMRLDTAKAPMLKIRSGRRPNVSATLAKKRRKEPDVRLLTTLARI